MDTNNYYEFPVSLEEFKKCTYYEELVEEQHKDIAKGNLELLALYNNSDHWRNKTLLQYYESFYLRPVIRETQPIRFKPMPRKRKETFLQFAKPKNVKCKSSAVEMFLRSEEKNLETMPEDDEEPHYDTAKEKPNNRPTESVDSQSLKDGEEPATLNKQIMPKPGKRSAKIITQSQQIPIPAKRMKRNVDGLVLEKSEEQRPVVQAVSNNNAEIPEDKKENRPQPTQNAALQNAQCSTQISRYEELYKQAHLFPVTFQEFLKYTSIKILTASWCQKTYGNPKDRFVSNAKRFYTYYYVRPDCRSKPPLNTLKFLPNCPEALKEKILEIPKLKRNNLHTKDLRAAEDKNNNVDVNKMNSEHDANNVQAEVVDSPQTKAIPGQHIVSLEKSGQNVQMNGVESEKDVHQSNMSEINKNNDEKSTKFLTNSSTKDADSSPANLNGGQARETRADSSVNKKVGGTTNALDKCTLTSQVNGGEIQTDVRLSDMSGNNNNNKSPNVDVNPGTLCQLVGTAKALAISPNEIESGKSILAATAATEEEQKHKPNQKDSSAQRSSLPAKPTIAKTLERSPNKVASDINIPLATAAQTHKPKQKGSSMPSKTTSNSKALQQQKLYGELSRQAHLCPVTFAQFKKYTNIIALMRSACETKYGSPNKNFGVLTKRAYLGYYLNPVVRLQYPLIDLQVLQNCPEDLKKKIRETPNRHGLKNKEHTFENNNNTNAKERNSPDATPGVPVSTPKTSSLRVIEADDNNNNSVKSPGHVDAGNQKSLHNSATKDDAAAITVGLSSAKSPNVDKCPDTLLNQRNEVESAKTAQLSPSSTEKHEQIPKDNRITILEDRILTPIKQNVLAPQQRYPANNDCRPCNLPFDEFIRGTTVQDLMKETNSADDVNFLHTMYIKFINDDDSFYDKPLSMCSYIVKKLVKYQNVCENCKNMFKGQEQLDAQRDVSEHGIEQPEVASEKEADCIEEMPVKLIPTTEIPLSIAQKYMDGIEGSSSGTKQTLAKEGEERIPNTMRESCISAHPSKETDPIRLTDAESERNAVNDLPILEDKNVAQSIPTKDAEADKQREFLTESPLSVELLSMDTGKRSSTRNQQIEEIKEASLVATKNSLDKIENLKSPQCPTPAQSQPESMETECVAEHKEAQVLKNRSHDNVSAGSDKDHEISKDLQTPKTVAIEETSNKLSIEEILNKIHKEKSWYLQFRSNVLKIYSRCNHNAIMPVNIQVFKRSSYYESTLKQILCDFCGQSEGLVEVLLQDKELYDTLSTYYYEHYFTQPNLRLKYPLKLKPCPTSVRNKMLSFADIISDDNQKAPVVVNKLQTKTTTIVCQKDAHKNDSNLNNAPPLTIVINQTDVQTTNKSLLTDQTRNCTIPLKDISGLLPAPDGSSKNQEFSNSLSPSSSKNVLSSDASKEQLPTSVETSCALKETNTTPVNSPPKQRSSSILPPTNGSSRSKSLRSSKSPQDTSNPLSPSAKETLSDALKHSSNELPSSSKNTASSDVLQAGHPSKKQLPTSSRNITKNQISKEGQTPICRKDKEQCADNCNRDRNRTENDELDSRLDQAKEEFFHHCSEWTLSLPYMIRVSYDLKQRIIAIIMDLNFEEFKRITHIYLGSELYDNADILNEMYKYVYETERIWPKNLFIDLKDLCLLLKTNCIGVPDASTLLKHISPKFLHWSNLKNYTNFVECASLHYFKQEFEHLDITDANKVENACNDYYNRCWTLDAWTNQVPILDTNHTEMVLLEENTETLEDIPLEEVCHDNASTSRPTVVRLMHIDSVEPTTPTPQPLAVPITAEPDVAMTDETQLMNSSNVSSCAVLPNTEQQIDVEITTLATQQLSNAIDPLQQSMDVTSEQNDDVVFIPTQIKDEPGANICLRNLLFTLNDANDTMECTRLSEEVVDLDNSEQLNAAIEDINMPPSDIDFSDEEETTTMQLCFSTTSRPKPSGDLMSSGNSGSSILNLGQRVPSSHGSNDTLYHSQTPAVDPVLAIQLLDVNLLSSESQSSLQQTPECILPTDQLDETQSYFPIPNAQRFPSTFEETLPISNVQRLPSTLVESLFSQNVPSPDKETLPIAANQLAKQPEIPRENTKNVPIPNAQRLPSTLVESLFSQNDPNTDQETLPIETNQLANIPEIPEENTKTAGSNILVKASIIEETSPTKNAPNPDHEALPMETNQLAKIPEIPGENTKTAENNRLVKASIIEETSSTKNAPNPDQEALPMETNQLAKIPEIPGEITKTAGNNRLVKANVQQQKKTTRADLVPQLAHALRALPVVTVVPAKPSTSKATSKTPSNASDENSTRTITIPSKTDTNVNNAVLSPPIFVENSPDFQPGPTSTQISVPPSEAAAAPSSSGETLRVSQELLRDKSLFDNTSLLRAVDQHYTKASLAPVLTGVEANNDDPPLNTNNAVVPLEVNNRTPHCWRPPTPPTKQRNILYRKLLEFHYFQSLNPNHVSKYQLPTVNYNLQYMEATIICGDLRTRLSCESLFAVFSQWSPRLRRDFITVLNDLKEFHYSAFERSPRADLRKNILHEFISSTSPFCKAQLTYDEHNSEFSECKSMRNSCNCPSQLRKPFKSLTHALKPNILNRLKTIKNDMKNCR